MTMYGYEIRNEYGLGAPEMYKTAYQDDPEAILEGVAVAGLAGFLRQLGDLAQFAAEIFDSLHEEITSTASRSRNIMLRVQQMESDLPMAEKDLYYHKYTDYALNEGISWHPNLDTDSNIVTKEDMPPYVMEFYKRSRGPPQLFRLDKFDKAGAGACLKRHTDPSFFRVDLSTYGIITQGYPREAGTVKPMRELSTISTNIARSLKMPQTFSRKEMTTKDQDSDEIPIRRVKLKQKQFNSSLLNNMQNLLETDSPAHESFSTRISYTSMELENSNESFTSVEKNKTNAFHKRLKSLGSLMNRNRQDTSSSDEKDDLPSSDLLSDSSTTQQNQTGSPPDQDTESGENSDDNISDATASEVEFLDALTTTVVDSEMETDSEVKDKNNPLLIRVGSRKLSSERKDERKDFTLLRSKSSSVRDNRDETEEVPINPVARIEDATVPDSDGGVSNIIKETEPHHRTVSFNKVASKKVSYQENELNPVATNENGKKTTPKLQKDSFSHSLRHMAKQLLDFKHDLTEDEDEEELDSQDLEEIEDEFLYENAGVQESDNVEKVEYLVENVRNGDVTDESSHLVVKDTEAVETENNIIGSCLGEDQADMLSQENEMHGLQNIESFEIERLNESKEFGEHEVPVISDVTIDGEKQHEISTDVTVTRNRTDERTSQDMISEAENLYLIKMGKLDSGAKMHADETSAGENVEGSEMVDGMVVDNLMGKLHESVMPAMQNLTLVKEQELVESEAYLCSHGTQLGEKTYETPVHGTVTKSSIKEVFHNDKPNNINLNPEEGEEYCKGDNHVVAHILQNEKNKTEKLTNEEMMDHDVSEPESINSNGALYESEMHVESDGATAETYELPVDSIETGNLIEPEDFDSRIAEFQIVNSIENKEELLEMDILSDEMQHDKEPHEKSIVSIINENVVTASAMPENLLQEQDAYHGDKSHIPESECSLEEQRILSDNATEPWDSHINIDLSVKALVDHYEFLEEETRDTEIQLVSPQPAIKDKFFLEALQSDNEPSEEEQEEKEDERGQGELPVTQVVEGEEAAVAESVNPVYVDPEKAWGLEFGDETVKVLGNEIGDHTETPAACNSEVISAPLNPVMDFDAELQDEAVTSVTCNLMVIPDRVNIGPPMQSTASTYNAREEGDITPPLPPLPPIQWRMGQPQMNPLHSLRSIAPPPHSSKSIPLPNFSNLGRPPRPKSSRVAAKEKKLHEVENEQIEVNCEIKSDTKELQHCVMPPSLERDTSVEGFSSVENNPICDETILRYEEETVRELSVKEEPLPNGDDKLEQEMKEEEQMKKSSSIPVPPKYPMFQVKSHDNNMLKKAPTLIQPASRLITPSMLEEIKNKSFSLKPVMVKRPNFMAPYSRTNLKVAAMLEKANAIRQAVGSDDSDNDSWSE